MVNRWNNKILLSQHVDFVTAGFYGRKTTFFTCRNRRIDGQSLFFTGIQCIKFAGMRHND